MNDDEGRSTRKGKERGAIGPEYFREGAALLAAGGPPDMGKLASVMHKLGLEPKPLPESVRS